jgi:uncharacterized protein
MEPVVMAANPPLHHSLNYIEFTVTDMAKAQAFYTAAFGWTFNAYGPDYAGIVIDGGEVGGFRSDQPVTKGGPLVIIYSHNLPATLTAVRKAGGTIAQEPYAFPGGRRFHFTDPSGNELAVWSEQ